MISKTNNKKVSNKLFVVKKRVNDLFMAHELSQ